MEQAWPTVVLWSGGHRGKSNAALVAKDITADDIWKEGDDEFRITVPTERLIVIPNFSATYEHCYYTPHDETFVPHGEEVCSEEGRSLRRTCGPHVTLLVRHGNHVYCEMEPCSTRPEWL